MTYVFSFTLGISAFLLFIIQPIIGKLLLPHFGGSPSVWNLCMVFFQTILLLGYIYSHLLSKLDLKHALLIHGLLLVTTFTRLPFPTNLEIAGEENPSFFLLKWLLINTALPFFTVSSTAPLLQKWFTFTVHKQSNDPYFLYAASNLGSFVALFTFPTIIEPYFQLSTQNKNWTIAFIVLTFLITVIAAIVYKSNCFSLPKSETNKNEFKITKLTKLNWIFCSFIPSTLMLGTTTHITTNIAAVPLLWIIPLALYLLSFIFTFQKNRLYPPKFLNTIFPGILLLSLPLIFLDITSYPSLVFIALTLFFFIISLYSHNKLSDLRPNTSKLTDYYLYISLGGVIGGIVNALIAPLLFNNILEYPLAIAAAALLINKSISSTINKKNIFILSFGIIIIQTIAAIYLKELEYNSTSIKLIIYYAIPGIILYSYRRNNLVYFTGLVFILFSLQNQFSKLSILSIRNFYGVKKITDDTKKNLRFLIHGNTEHGAQSKDSNRKLVPLTYYYPNNPVGDVFNLINKEKTAINVGIAGLGTGAIACYSRPSDKFTFYEIDPAIFEIANNKKLFTYWSDCPGIREIVLGDARHTIGKALKSNYDLLILDAFSSDSVPVHLITKEAITSYLSKIKDDGLLLFHISNRHLDLEPVLANIGKDIGLNVYIREDTIITEEENSLGKYASSFLIMSKTLNLNEKNLKKWKVAKENSSIGIWTDSFSSITSVIKK